MLAHIEGALVGPGIASSAYHVTDVNRHRTRPAPHPSSMSTRTSWRNLIPGMLALAVVIGVALAVLLFARVGMLHGRTVRMYASTSAARGVMRGTQVWLAGQWVGQVRGIHFANVDAPDSARIVMEIDVLREYLPHFRTDATMRIQSGGTLIGAPVLAVSPGTPGGRPLGAGDTIRARAQSDFEGVTSQVALASRQFPEIIANVQLMRTNVNAASGTVGALLSDDGGGMRRFETVMGRASSLTSRATSGGGTVGLAMHGDAFARASAARARVDSLRRALDARTRQFSEAKNDSALARAITSVRAEAAAVGALLSGARGTAGRVLHDRAAQNEIAALKREIDALIDDLRRHPLRYVNF